MNAVHLGCLQEVDNFVEYYPAVINLIHYIDTHILLP